MIQRRRDAEKWMSNRCLPELLKERVRQAQQFSWYATGGVTEKMVLENLPEDLLIDIRRHLFNFIKKVRILQRMDRDDESNFLDAIHERLIHMTYIQGSRIFSQGGRIQKTVFVVRGKLESIGEDGIPVPLFEGDVCGEELLAWYIEQSSEIRGKKVKLQRQGLISDRTVRCLTHVEAFLLRIEDIEEITSLFASFLRRPRVQERIRSSIKSVNSISLLSFT